MEWLKNALFGALVGASYAFISFYLITPGSNFDFIFLVMFGINGIIFALSYKALSLVWKSRKTSYSKFYFSSIVTGVISGLIAGVPNIYLTYSANIIRQTEIVPQEIVKLIHIDLMQYALGCMLIGFFIGYLNAYIKVKSTYF